jgi:hypothetical protein
MKIFVRVYYNSLTFKIDKENAPPEVHELLLQYKALFLYVCIVTWKYDNFI